MRTDYYSVKLLETLWIDVRKNGVHTDSQSQQMTDKQRDQHELKFFTRNFQR